MRFTDFTGAGLLVLHLQAHLSAALNIPTVIEPTTAGRYVVPLHRQRVPVKTDTEIVSYKSVYFGHVTVGAPVPQSFTVVFDTGSGHVVLPSSWCTSETCLIHNRYNSEASAHAVDVEHDGTPVDPLGARDQITVAYGTGEVTGQFVNDRLCLGIPGRDGAVGDMSAPAGEVDEIGEAAPHCVEMRIVMATEMTHEPFHAFTFDGVLGLGLDSLALEPEFSFFGMMTAQKQLEQPSFGVFLADNDNEISEISFGGHAPEHLKTELSWAPVALPELGYWQVQIKSMRIGDRTLDFCDDGECRAVVDTGTSLLAVPQLVADELQNTLETSIIDPPTDEDGMLDCKKAQGSQIIFEVEGATLTLGPGDYSRASVQAQEDIGLESTGSCRPTIMPLDLPEPLGPKLFIWGEPVLRKYYTTYNWKEQRIGFAEAKHSDDEQAKTISTKTRRKPLLL